ncbi:MAG: PAS domain S-box protein [Hyphomicrobium sp.]|nr:PAS domain S-box protein [Hyphomicrobium sp.]
MTDSIRDDTLPKTSSLSRTHDQAAILSEVPGAAALGLQLLASSPDCVKLLDTQGNIHFINENGLKLIGIDAFSDIEAKPWSSLWPVENAALVANAIANAVGGAAGRFAALAPTPKGTPKWWDVTVSPVYDDAGTLVWLLAVSRDITHQRQIESIVQTGEQRFRALADNIAQFAWMADASGNVYWYNQRWFNYTGTSLADMAGWGWQKLLHPDDVDRVLAKVHACLKDSKPWDDTFALRGADGSYRWFLSRAMPIRDDDGNVVLWCGTNTDITDQRKASQRLSQLARLIELSHEAILVWDLDDGVLLWNRGCVELFGYSESEALGANSHTLLNTTHALSREKLITTLEAEGKWSGEFLRRAKDGGEVWTDCRLELIRVGDRRVVLETNRDVSERRRADDIRNVLIAELNHRIKNTLAIVQSLALQTARSSPSMAAFVQSFSGRIQSLSSAHNVLTDTNWCNASVAELVASQIIAAAGTPQRITISGPQAFLAPQTALHVTLILHELTTNAIKHGALSDQTGRINVSWSVAECPERKLRLVWDETGGDGLIAPSDRGFGLNLIERSGRLPHITTRLDFRSCGVFCEIFADLDDATPASATYFNPGRVKVRSVGQS